MINSSYMTEIRRLLDLVEITQAEAVSAAADLVAERLAAGRPFHLLGTGHAHMLAEELFYRAGGLFNINPILDPGLMLHSSALASSQFERLPGYARIVLDQHPLAAGDAILIASNSGVNAVPVEAALVSKERGLKVIALTSLNHSRSVDPRHPSGKKLFELADIVLDNCGCLGDAALEVAGLPGKIEATSTVIGAVILHSLTYEIVQRLIQVGQTPPVVISANVPGGDQYNETGFNQLRGRIRSL